LFGYSTLLSGAESLRGGLQIVLVGARATPDAAALLRVVHGVSLPGRSLDVVEPGSTLPPSHPAAGKTQIDGKPTVYLCRGATCSAPIVEPEALALERFPLKAVHNRRRRRSWRILSA
jgi:hypothetical protein